MATYRLDFVNTQTGVKNTAAKGLEKEQAMTMRDTFNKMATDGIVVAKVFIEMNQHEKVINQIIQECISEWIGGCENALTDYPEDSEDYKNAKAMLNHDSLYEAFYDDIMEETRKNAKSHLRFAGKKFIEERIEAALKKCGYGA